MRCNYATKCCKKRRAQKTGLSVFTVGVLSVIFVGTTAAPGCNNQLGKIQEVSCDGVASSDAFINLCGICVAGQTGRTATEGMDQCQVCYGNNECLGCDGQLNSGLILDDCGQCLQPTSPLWNNCVRITSVTPNVLDKAVDSIDNVLLRGAGINRTSIPNISCKLSAADASSQKMELPEIKMATVEDDVIQVEVVFTDQRGLYTLKCSSSEESESLMQDGLGLTLVNSQELSVTAISPISANVDEPISAKLTVPGVSANSNVLCFVKDKGVENTHTLQPVSISEGEVVCGNFTAHQARILEFGVVYTEDAAMEKDGTGTPGEVTVRAPAPLMKQATFSDDLQSIYIEFNQNVNGSSSCNEIFESSTLLELGNDPKCTFLANSLVIKLGKDSSVQVNSVLQLKDGSKVYRAFSDPNLAEAARGNVAVKIPPKELISPKYRVVAPKFVCPDIKNSMRLTSLGGQNLKYSWTVNFNVSAVPSRGQTANLNVWRNVRMMAKELKTLTAEVNSSQLPLNASMFKAGIPYELNLVGTNSLGMRGETKTFTMELATQPNMIDIILLGPESAHVDTDYYVEAKVISCNSTLQLDDLAFEWKLLGENTMTEDLPTGKRLRLPNGVLRGGREYKITCTVTPGSGNTTVLATGELTMRTTMRGIMPILGVSEMTLGTGQPLILDASKSYDPDNNLGDMQFQWCCHRDNGDACLVPEGGTPTILERKYEEAFKKSVLELPPGSLAIGVYNFTVSAFKDVNEENNTGSAWTQVIVIPGSPPRVNITSDAKLGLVDPGMGVTILAAVSSVRTDCRMWWAVRQEIGFEYFDLKGELRLGDVVRVTLEEARSGLPREFPLTIPGPLGNWPGLKGDTKYKLRLTAACPIGNETSPIREVEGYADVTISTNSPPVVKPLEVNPVQGEALRTQFEFSTSEAYDMTSDMPLQYNFGYRVDGDDVDNIFSSSNEVLQAYTLLPAGKDQETLITPILQVCDSHKLCSVSEGKQVKTRSPTELSEEEVDKVLKLLSTLISSGQYSEALSLTKTSLQTLNQMSNITLYEKATQEMKTIILSEMKIRRERLDTNPGSAQDSLDFLDMVLSMLKYLPMADSIFQEFSDFKDAIQNVISKNNNLVQRNRLKRNIRMQESWRNKREATTTEYTEDNVRKLMRADEFLILSASTTDAVDRKKKFLVNVKEYMVGLCKTSTKLVTIACTKIGLTIKKFPIKMAYDEKFPLLEGLSPLKQSNIASAILPEIALKKYTFPLCLASTFYYEDYLTETASSDSQNNDLLARSSNVIGIWLMNTKELLSIEPPNLLTLQLPVNSIQIGDQEQLQCAVWKDGWTHALCETLEFVSSNAPPYLKCNCKILGYYSAFSVQMTTTNIPTTTTTTTTTTTELPTTTTTTTTEPPTTTTTTEPPTTTTTTTTELPTTTTTTTTEPPTTTTTTELPTTTTTTTTEPPTTTITTEIPTTTSPTTKEIVTSPSTAIPTTEPTTSEEATTEVTLPPTRIPGVPISDPVCNATFRIDEDYNTTVGDQKEEFITKVRLQILDQVDMPANMIHGITVAPGSVIITMMLVDTDVRTVDEVVPVIDQVLKNRKLVIRGLDGTVLKVPSQNVKIIYTNVEEKHSMVMYAVGGVIGASTAAITALVIAAIVFKKRKEAARLTQIKTSAQSTVPTYRQFQFEDSIDGSEDSLQRYRSSHPTMGTVGTLVGSGMLTGLGTQLDLTPSNRTAARYGIQTQGSRSLQGVSVKKRKKRRKKELSGSHRYLVQHDETATGNNDHDSGILDGDGQQQIKNKAMDRKNRTTADCLPGTPEDNYN